MRQPGREAAPAGEITPFLHLLKKECKMKKAVFTLIGLTMIGCTAPVKYVDRATGDQFKEGESTYKEVRAIMGKPALETDLETNKTMICYNNSEAEQNPAAAVPIVGLFFSGVKVESRSLCFTFENDVLVKKSYTAHTARSGMNAPE